MISEIITKERLHPDTGFYATNDTPYAMPSTIVIYPKEMDGAAYGFPGQTVLVVSYMKMADGKLMVGGNEQDFTSAHGESKEELGMKAASFMRAFLKANAGKTLIHKEFGSGEKMTVRKIADCYGEREGEAE